MSPEIVYAYNLAQRWLHWIMAVLILAAIALGAASSFFPIGQEPRKSLLELHKSLGFTIFALVLVRLMLRLYAGEPAYRKPLGRLTRLASRVAHASLYALMIVMPLTGYLFSAADGYSLPWFGLFQWPRLSPRDSALSQRGEWLHDKLAWVIAAVVTVHLVAVARHHWIKRDEVLSRMTG